MSYPMSHISSSKQEYNLRTRLVCSYETLHTLRADDCIGGKRCDEILVPESSQAQFISVDNKVDIEVII